MSGPRLHTDAAGVKDFWREHAQEMLDKRGFMFVNRQDATDFERSQEQLVPHVSMSRWCADCPRCRGGIALWREHDENCCLDCGTIYTKVAWPAEVEEVERALMTMPVPDLRNWHPHRETVKELVRRMDDEQPPDPVQTLAEQLKLSPATVQKVLDARDSL